MKNKRYYLISMLIALAVITGCSLLNPASEGLAIGKGKLNVVEAFDLTDSVRLEILAFDMENVDSNSNYIPAAIITNLGELEEIIFLLDGELRESPALFCIPEYQLRFWLEDGATVDLGYSCQDARFLTGEQAVFGGRQFSPPAKFSGLIDSYLHASIEQPESINLLKAAEFTDVVEIQISEQLLGDGLAEVTSLLTINDIEVIEEFLLAMSGDFTLQPRARCPVEYFISFTMADDRIVTFGCLCGGDDHGLLRGDQDYFYGQDIHLGADFVALFDGLVNP